MTTTSTFTTLNYCGFAPTRTSIRTHRQQGSPRWPVGPPPGAALFELRATLDDFELRGQPVRAAFVAAVSRMHTDGAVPEVALARDALDQADATRS